MDTGSRRECDKEWSIKPGGFFVSGTQRGHLTEEVVKADNHRWAVYRWGFHKPWGVGVLPFYPSVGCCAPLCSGQLVTTGGRLSPTKAVYWLRLLWLLTATWWMPWWKGDLLWCTQPGLINEGFCQEATLGVNYSFQKWLDRHYCTNYFTSLGSVPNFLTHTREQTPRLTEADSALIKGEIVCDSPFPLPSTPPTLFSQRRREWDISFMPWCCPAQSPRVSGINPWCPQHMCWALAKWEDLDGGSIVLISGFLITCTGVGTIHSPTHFFVYFFTCLFFTYVLNAFYRPGTTLRTSRVQASKSLLPGGGDISYEIITQININKAVTMMNAIIRGMWLWVCVIADWVWLGAQILEEVVPELTKFN